MSMICNTFSNSLRAAARNIDCCLVSLLALYFFCSMMSLTTSHSNSSVVKGEMISDTSTSGLTKVETSTGVSDLIENVFSTQDARDDDIRLKCKTSAPVVVKYKQPPTLLPLLQRLRAKVESVSQHLADVKQREALIAASSKASKKRKRTKTPKELGPQSKRHGPS